MSYRNIRLHPVLRFLYFLFRALAWAGTGVFFRRRLVLGGEHFRFDGPAILITNHPSTLMDVFNPGIPVRQEMFFLANYGLFKHPVMNWLLTRLFCIPVKRREDVAEGEARNNDSAFRQSFQHLEKGGVLFIAAEGTSWMHRFVREFKTGTARIAFGAEHRNNWNLALKIVPVGLSYYAANLFRSDVVVQCGPPVYARDWAEAWRQNPEQAVNDLTEELQRRVTGLTIHTRDEAGEKLIAQLEEIRDNEYRTSLQESFLNSQRLAATQLDNLELKTATSRYFESLHRSGLTDRGLRCWSAPNAGWRAFADSFILIAGLLPFLAGYAFWFLPCFLPWWLNKKLDLYVGYSSTVKMGVGLLTFPLALWAAYRFFPAWTGWQHYGPAFVLLAVVLGLWAERYATVARRTRERLRAGNFARTNPDRFAALLALRNGILPALK